MLSSIEISHYKSISEAKLRFGNVNVLSGVNSVGKSNAVDTLAFIRDIAANGADFAVSKRHGIESIKQWSKSRPFHVTICAEYRSSRGYGNYKITFSSMKGEFRIIREEGLYTKYIKRPNRPDRLVLSSSFVREAENNVRIKNSPFFDRGNSKIPDEFDFNVDRDEAFISGLRNVSSSLFGTLNDLWAEITDFHIYSIFPNTLRQAQSPSNERQLDESGKNIASVFKTMQKTKAGQRGRSEIVYLLQKVLPQLDNVYVQSVGGYLIPVFRVTEEDGHSHDLNVSQVSDGFLRLFGILTALYQPFAPSVIVIEEPEQNVHPGVLPLLAEAIKEAGENSKIVLTTHSPILLDQFQPEDVVSVSKDDSGTTIRRLRGDQIEVVKQNLYTVGELMQVEGL